MKLKKRIVILVYDVLLFNILKILGFVPQPNLHCLVKGITMDRIESLLKITAALVAIVVPIILLSGYSYHLGYVMTFGLDVDLIPKRLPDMLIESWYVGVLALAWVLSKWSYFLTLFIVFCLYCLAIFLFFLRAKKRGNTAQFEEFTKENQGKPIIGLTPWQWMLLGQLFRTSFIWFFTPFLLIAVIALLAVKPYQQGEEEAKTKIEAFKQNGCDENKKVFSCIYLLDITNQPHEVITKGILVSANQDRIAIFNNELEIWPFLDSYIIKKKIKY